ncbi:MAG TPA: pitrilysin family protein [Gemmatimonadaceae bacterium]|nr:pitrilysin family protein [Gemmatimonadaceae bacterium]
MPAWLDALASTVRIRLDNGLTVLVRRDTSAPVAAVVTHVKAGYFDESDDVSGIAHVLEHMFFKGTPTRGVGEIARATKAQGGYLNAATIYDYTTYYAVLPRDGFPTGLAIQADAYANALIDAGELARELEVIIEEAKRKADNPSAVATESLYALLYDRHRIRRWRIGHEAGLRALTRDDVRTFYSNFYRPGNTILAIVGDIDVDATLHQVASLYGSLPAGEPVRDAGPNEQGTSGFRYRELKGDIAQTHVAFGWRTPGALHSDTPLLDVAGAVLAMGRSSRLYRAVRERRFASSASAYNYTPTDIGVFGAETEGPPERAWDAAKAVWSEIQSFTAHGPAEAELERTRRLTDARWSRRLETMDGQANLLAEWEALGDWRLVAEYYERITSATAEQVRDAAARYLSPNDVALLVYRPDAAPVFAHDEHLARETLAAGCEVVAAATETPRAPAILSRNGVEPEGVDFGVEQFRSAQGIPILVKRRPGAPLVHFGVYASGGVSAEPNATVGLTTLLGRAALKGTHSLSGEQIAEIAESLGGSISPSTSPETSGWSLSVPPAQFAEAVALLAQVVQYPAFAQSAIDTERAIALSQLEQLRDDMMRYPIRLALEAAFQGHPYARLTLGDEETLLAVTPAAVAEWHAQRVVQSNSVIAVVGDIEPLAAARTLASAFAELRSSDAPTVEVPAWPAQATTRAESREKAQSALALAFPGPHRTDPQRFAADVLTGIASGLGGRFFEELRDRRSLAYTVHVHALQRRRAGAIVSYIATSPDKEDAARHGLLAQFARLRAEPVTPDELERSKNYLVGSHAIARQSGAAVLGELVDAWLLGDGLSELESYEYSIRSVTAEQIQILAQHSFDADRRVEGAVRGSVLVGAHPVSTGA